MKRPKIFLIGYRATGKSLAGRALAHLLGCPFVDLDDYICSQEGKSVREMVEREGWQYFRKKEREALRDMLALEGPLVVACGGGAVLHEDLFERIFAEDWVVWLTARQETIIKRMQSDKRNKETRPALTEAATLADEVARILSERQPLYRRYACFSVATDCISPDEVARLIAERLGKE